MKDNLRKSIQPYAARIISSSAVLNAKRCLVEYKRRLLQQPHQVAIYLRINDPYSYLLVQVLPDLQRRFQIEMHFKTILHLRDDMYPEAEMWHDNAFIDANHLAHLYDLKFPSKAPQQTDAESAIQATHKLLSLESLALEKDFDWQQVNRIFEQYWFPQDCDSSELSRGPVHQDETKLAQHLIENEQTLAKQGHYMSAMLHYNGEWYWGLDRLDHLEKRLNTLGVNDSRYAKDVVFNKTYVNFCQQPAIDKVALGKQALADKKLIVFFSIRSPYSHIGLEQVIKLAQHYDLTLDIKPILPMIMRGLSVPDSKKMYIFHDTKREASKLGIDYGFVADPLGQGVENCYSLFAYAQSLGCEQSFLLNYARGVNAQGIRSETDKGLKLIVQRSGMDWAHAKTLLQDPATQTAWHQWAEDNRQQMLALGSWGVPTLQYGDLVLWGQDRLGLIEQAIRKERSLK